MAITYPGTIDSFTDPSGTQTLGAANHSGLHIDTHAAIEAIETVLGTTAGTSVLKDFAAGNFPARINTSNVLQQAVSGTINNSVLGTPAITGGTISTGVLTGQQTNSGTIGGGVYGTALHQGGTVANAVIGTPTLLGGTIAISGTTTPANIGEALAPTVGTASDAAAGTITVNAQAAQLYEINLGTTAGNRTIGTPANAVNGQFLGYRIKQNTANTGTLVWSAIFRGTVSASALGTQATWNYYGWRYNATDTKWDFQGNSVGVI